MKYLILVLFFFNSCDGDYEKNLKKELIKKSDWIQKDTFISNNETLFYVHRNLNNNKIFSFQDDTFEKFLYSIAIDSNKLSESIDTILEKQIERSIYNSYYYGNIKDYSIIYCQYEYGDGLILVSKKKQRVSKAILISYAEGDGYDNYFLNLIMIREGIYKQILIYGLNNETDDDLLKIKKIKYNDLVLGQEGFEQKNFSEKKVNKTVSISRPFVKY